MSSSPCSESVAARIKVVVADITRLSCDAIVNAANHSLLGGGGVDGAIHRAAGPRLLEHNRQLGGCETGRAKITPGFDLKSQGINHIIHTVGPVWHGPDQLDEPIGQRREDVLLASCYDHCLSLAHEHQVRELAFPAISTGVYNFPQSRAAAIAIERVCAWLNEHALPQQVVFCCFSDEAAQHYRQRL